MAEPTSLSQMSINHLYDIFTNKGLYTVEKGVSGNNIIVTVKNGTTTIYNASDLEQKLETILTNFRKTPRTSQKAGGKTKNTSSNKTVKRKRKC